MLGYDATDERDSTSTWRSRVHRDDVQPRRRGPQVTPRAAPAT